VLVQFEYVKHLKNTMPIVTIKFDSLKSRLVKLLTTITKIKKIKRSKKSIFVKYGMTTH
jgi:hypothetical protein